MGYAYKFESWVNWADDQRPPTLNGEDATLTYSTYTVNEYRKATS